MPAIARMARSYRGILRVSPQRSGERPGWLLPPSSIHR